MGIEERTVARFVINCCLKSKDDTYSGTMRGHICHEIVS